MAATELHMKEFSGTTFGMEVQNPAAFKILKKNITYAYVKPQGWSREVKRRVVPAKYVAAVMGQAAWLVSELRLMESLWWEDSGDIFITYDDSKGEIL